MNRRFAALPLALLLALSLAACSAAALPAAQADELAGLLTAREQAVLTGDRDAYLQTVDPDDPVLLVEERNLIDAARGLAITTYTLDTANPKTDGDTLTATLTQRSTIDGEERSCSYPARFVRQDGEWYYAGPAFTRVSDGAVAVDYLGNSATLARALLGIEGEVLSTMEDQLGTAPRGDVTIRLYDDQQVFLQTVKLDLPAWVGGWHEYGEAIKTFVGGYGSAPEDYRAMLCHETTHLLVSELSGDNAAYWLQEGLAGCLEEALPAGGSPTGALTLDDPAFSLVDLKAMDLEALEPGNPDVTAYYATAKVYAAFLLDQYGWQRVQAMLERMAQRPMIEQSANEKRLETNTRTDEALAASFGFDDPGFQKSFDQWWEENNNG